MRKLGTIGLIGLIVVGSCSSPSDETCDGGEGAASEREAITMLLEAAYASDSELACAAIVRQSPGVNLSSSLNELKERAHERSIRPGDIEVVRSEQLGSVTFVEVTSSENTLDPMTFDVKILRNGKRFSVSWPAIGQTTSPPTPSSNPSP